MNRALHVLFFTLLFSSVSIANEKSEFEFLNQMKTLRVFYEDSSGLGHGAANINLIRRLREIGFRNNIEVFYWNYTGIGESIKTMLPWAKLDNTFHNDTPLGPMGFYTMEAFGKIMEKKKGIPFSITAAYDFPVEATWTRKIKLQVYMAPLNWWQEGACRKNGTEYLPICNSPELIKMGYKYYVPTPADQTIFFHEEFAGNPREKAVAEVYKAEREYLVLSAYGFHNVSPYHAPLCSGYTMFTLARALQETSIHKGIVIPVYSKLNENEWSYFDKLSQTTNKISRLPYNSPQLFTKLQNLQGKEVLFVDIGNIPQSIFHYVFSQSDLPPTLYGSNGISLMRQLGAPFIPTFKSALKYILPEPATMYQTLEQVSKRMYCTTADQKPTEEDIKFVASYIEELLRDSSPLENYFKSMTLTEDRLTYQLTLLKNEIIEAINSCADCD